MKQISLISTAICCLMLGAAATAQQPGSSRDASKPAPQNRQAQPSRQPQASQQRPSQQQAGQQRGNSQGTAGAVRNQGKQQPSYGGAFHGGVKPNGPAYGGVHESGVPQQRMQVRKGFAQSRAGSWQNEHKSWGQRGGYNGYRIPEARFRSNFGHNHYFRIYGLPLVFVGGLPRFQYDGYWITILDPWPESWGPYWYETDDVYLDYTDDGYYLYDRLYPDYPIAVTVSF